VRVLLYNNLPHILRQVWKISWMIKYRTIYGILLEKDLMVMLYVHDRDML